MGRRAGSKWSNEEREARRFKRVLRWQQRAVQGYQYAVETVGALPAVGRPGRKLQGSEDLVVCDGRDRADALGMTA